MKDEEAPVVIADRITPLVEMKTQKLYIKISKDRDITTFERIKPILQRHGGNTPVIVYFEHNREKAMADRRLWVTPSEQLVSELQDMLGDGCIKVR